MQHDNHHVPVTALAVCGEDVVVTGDGNYICAYEQSGKFCVKSKVFETQAVHGIAQGKESPGHGVIWGGALIRHFCFEGTSITLGPILTAQDWILDAAIAPSSSSVGIVTAHNALWLFDHLEYDGNSPAPLERIVAGSNCILYSAHVKWLSSSHCLIASGTAFGDIILWSVMLVVDDGKTAVQSQTHYSFPAHDGSIFGVQISPMSRLPGAQTTRRVLATCSDDRNIKLWDVSGLATQCPTLTDVQRDTGFGSRLDDAGLSPPCLAKAMGHGSRIWHLRFTDVSVDKTLSTVTSFGEDASAIKWQIENNQPDADLPYSLAKLRRTNAHAGKNIWATTVTSNGTPITGGADGAIALHMTPITTDTETEISHNLLPTSDGDRFKTYCFVAPYILFTSTECGNLILIDYSDGKDSIVTTVASALTGLRGYSILQGVEGFGFAGGTDGKVYLYTHQSGKTLQVAFLGKKTAGLFPCTIDKLNVALLVTSVGSTSAELIFINNGDSRTRTSVTLRLPHGFIVTSFVFVSGNGSDRAVLGSRAGSLLLFTLESSSSSSTATIQPQSPLALGKEAITSLYHVPASAAQRRGSHIFSTARDGTLSVHTILRTAKDTLQLEFAHQLSLPFGPNVEGLHLDASQGRCWAWGFRSKDFVVYDVVAQREILSVECGGVHRTWAFHSGNGDGEVNFVWTKAGRIFWKKQTQLPWEIIKRGGHGREIKAASISPRSQALGGVEGRLIATGAEDTDIKISRLITDDKRQSHLRCLQTLRRHNTGIQHLSWSRDGHTLFSSGGFEEFFVWRVNPDVPFVDIGVVCASNHPRSGMSDLRIMGFDAHEDDRRVGFRFVMAYSDSSVAVWRYSPGEGREWEREARADYLTACLRHVIRLPGCENRANEFLTTATDGHIVKWSSRGDVGLRWTNRQRVHQNAVLASDTQTLPDGSILLATGGDDGAIAFTRYNTGSGKFEVPLRRPRAHAGAVTGLTFVTAESAEGNVRLVTVGLDQRVKMWAVEGDDVARGLAVKVKMVQDVFTAVADGSALEVWSAGNGIEARGQVVLVCGVGVDVWRLSTVQAGPNGFGEKELDPSSNQDGR